MTARRLAAACWHATVTVCLCALVAVAAMLAVTIAIPPLS